MKTGKKTTGMVLGKFLPPHYGHIYLGEFAKNFVTDLTIVVGTMPSEPIPGQLRFDWMKSLFPDATVVHLDKVLPQDPSEHPQFWEIWKRELSVILPEPPDFVFASENYGIRLAKELGASYIPVDQSRDVRQISGTAIRESPYLHWQQIPPCVRAYYAKRICIFGPESTGKSTLTTKLANHFQTIAVPEYARNYIEQSGRELTLPEMDTIVKGQLASEAALAPYCNQMLFTDTDALATSIWSEYLFNEVSITVKEAGQRTNADLYLLLDVDVPWIDDQVRYLPENSKDFFDRCEQILKLNKKNYVVISGTWEERWSAAFKAIERLSDLKK